MVYHMSMSRSPKPKPLAANIAVLKAQLSRFLRRVKAGEEVIVMDRQLPVARIVPLAKETASPVPVIRVAEGSWSGLAEALRANDVRLKPTRLRRSVVDYLGEDRGER